MQIKFKGEKKYIRESTEHSNFVAAEEVARNRYFELKIMRDHGLPIFSKTVTEIAEMAISALHQKAELGGVSKLSVEKYEAKIRRFIIPHFGNRVMEKINQSDITRYWKWRINYWVVNKDRDDVKGLPTAGRKPKPVTLENEVVLLNLLFDTAIKGEYYKAERKPDLKPPVKSNGKNRRSALTRAEYCLRVARRISLIAFAAPVCLVCDF